MSTHNGKIGRLPKAIREQLNHRLADGEPGQPILVWLNNLPEVQALLAREFDGKPINQPNLSHWRTGGYQHWLKQQDRVAMIRQLAEDVEELSTATGSGNMASQVSALLTADFAVTALEVLAGITDPAEKCQRMQEMLQTLARARHQDYLAGKLKIQEERREQERRQEAAEEEERREMAPVMQELRRARLAELHSQTAMTSPELAHEVAIALFKEVEKAQTAEPAPAPPLQFKTK